MYLNVVRQWPDMTPQSKFLRQDPVIKQSELFSERAISMCSAKRRYKMTQIHANLHKMWPSVVLQDSYLGFLKFWSGSAGSQPFTYMSCMSQNFCFFFSRRIYLFKTFELFCSCILRLTANGRPPRRSLQCAVRGSYVTSQCSAGRVRGTAEGSQPC